MLALSTRQVVHPGIDAADGEAGGEDDDADGGRDGRDGPAPGQRDAERGDARVPPARSRMPRASSHTPSTAGCSFVSVAMARARARDDHHVRAGAWQDREQHEPVQSDEQHSKLPNSIASVYGNQNGSSARTL